MKMNVPDEIIEQAKEEMLEFDKQKTYNKFVCNHNYIGLLGEMMFNQYLNENNIPHTWVQFTKKGWNQPDFIINGKTVDIKTTYSDSLWFTSPKFDVYVLCKLTKDDKVIDIQGYITKEDILLAIEYGVAKRIAYKGRNDYCISSIDLDKFEHVNIFAAHSP